MARPLITRPPQTSIPAPTGKGTPGSSADPAQGFFDQPQGEDYNQPLTRMGANLSPFVQNLRFLLSGKYGVRWGTINMGVAAGSAVCGLSLFSFTDGNDYLIRVTTTGVDLWGGSSWNPLVGPALNLNSWIYVEFTVWGNLLLFTDRVTGLYAINILSASYSAVSGSPVGKHLTTFDSRAIVSNIVYDAYGGPFPTRIEWSVKNDYTDYVGYGSGYEDLLSAPGGTVDIQQAIIPVTDTQAFVLRSRSMWLMETTGYFDAPFNFSQHFGEGTNSPQTVVRVPSEKVQGTMYRTLYAQVMLLGSDDVLLMKPEGVFPLGSPVREHLLTDSTDPRNAIAAFDYRMREYHLYIPSVPDETQSNIWRYQIDNQRWVHDLYPFKINRMAFKDFLIATSYDQLTGTFDQLTGAFDALGVVGPEPSAFFATSGFHVMRSYAAQTSDTDDTGATVGIPVEIWTGAIQNTGPQYREGIIMVEMEYETSRTVTIEIDYSLDGGTTWSPYGSWTLAATTRPTIVALREYLEETQIMLRLKSTDGGGFKLHAIFPTGIEGSSINN
jgi:hypothetical protein